ncbi:hypothetical protein GWC94_06220 [Sediminibacterium sp. WSJ-3]|nr:hypothetical protein [Sediminibacterium soli]
MVVFRRYIVKFITLLLALQLLNLSIYGQGFTPIPVRADAPEINISETVVEFVVEVILKHKNAIPEQDQQDGHDLQFHKHLSFEAIDFRPYFLPGLPAVRNNKPVALNPSYDYLYLREINPPPPKA